VEELILVLKFYALMAVRISAIIILFPGFGSTGFPGIAKIFIIGAISLVVIMGTPAIAAPVLSDNIMFAVYIIKEAFIGFFIGFFSQVPFMAVRAAGDMISFNTMFSMANVIDPTMEQQVTVWGEFYNIMAMLMFFAINGHLIILKGIVYSFAKISVLEPIVFNQAVLEKVTTASGSIFMAGVLIAAPVAVTLFMSNISMGIVSRTMPQFNVFMVGIPLQIMLAFMLIIIMVPMDIEIIRNIIARMFTQINGLLAVFAR
jgi:flagellar biosynthetic protein FliR